jgi:hypothetical protein
MNPAAACMDGLNGVLYQTVSRKKMGQTPYFVKKKTVFCLSSEQRICLPVNRETTSLPGAAPCRPNVGADKGTVGSMRRPGGNLQERISEGSGVSERADEILKGRSGVVAESACRIGEIA